MAGVTPQEAAKRARDLLQLYTRDHLPIGDDQAFLETLVANALEKAYAEGHDTGFDTCREKVKTVFGPKKADEVKA